MARPVLWWVYLAECSDGTYYCGITTDKDRREKQHNGLLPGGSKYCAGRRPVKLVWWRSAPTKSLASMEESTIKKFSRKKKEQLITGKSYSSVILDAV